MSIHPETEPIVRDSEIDSLPPAQRPPAAGPAGWDLPSGADSGTGNAGSNAGGASSAGSAEMHRLFEMTDDLLAVISLDGRFTLLNPAWEAVLGWKREEMLGHPIHELIHPEDVDQAIALTVPGTSETAQLINLTNRYRHRDGSWRWLLWSARCDGQAWFAAAKDVTDRMWLERQALHDPLTKLPNRLLLMDRTRRALTRLPRSGGLIALLFVDLDRFKAINDNLGHAVGDDLLISVSERLQQVLRDSDTVARLGGDEFVILAEDMESDTEALAMAERVLNALEEPTSVGSAEVSMQASVGISICHERNRDPEDLLHEADVAMYRAKATTSRRIELFDEDLRQEIAERLQIESRLRHALSRHELRLVYQPVMRLDGGPPLICEALLRWHPHDGPPIAPGEFLHLAEESKLIVEIGEWALQSACMQAATWRREGIPVAVSVNVSARSLAEVDIARRVQEALAYSELPGQALCLEVSEAAASHDLDRARATLQDCKRLGVKIALDNFGAGHSSLSLPCTLPLDVVKVDRSLIQDFEHDRAKRAIVMAATAMARETGIEAVAVGIETERQLALSREVGFALGQGFLLCAPGTPELLPLGSHQPVRSPLSWRSIARRSRRPHNQLSSL
jgi:diguanylate cyclase (GGDEF)-like protein/PAS domain S-box-containing protein